MRKLTWLGAAALLAVAAAGCSSTTTTTNNSGGTATPTTVSGIETFTGQVTGAAALASNASIPLTWTGPVSTTSTFSTGGSAPKKGQNYTFQTAAGNFTVLVSGTVTNTQKLLSATTCQFRFAVTVPYTVNGAASTGKFAGATGSGAVTVTIEAFLPKLASGKCDLSGTAQPATRGAIAAARGSGPLTIKT
jgi:hypothetical protein